MSRPYTHASKELKFRNYVDLDVAIKCDGVHHFDVSRCGSKAGNLTFPEPVSDRSNSSLMARSLQNEMATAKCGLDPVKNERGQGHNGQTERVFALFVCVRLFLNN